MPDPKGKAPAVTPVRRSPRLAAGAGETLVREKLLEDAMHAAHVIDTHQHFPKVSPPRSQRLQKQFHEEDFGSGSAFPRIKEVPQDVLFVAMESEESGEGLSGDDGDCDDGFSEGGGQLDIGVIDSSPPLSEIWGPAEDVLAMQG